MLKLVIFASCVALAFGRLHEQLYGKKLGDLAVVLHEKCSLYTGATNDEIEKLKSGNFNSSNLTIMKVDLNLNINLERMKEIEPELFHGKGVTLHSNCVKEAIDSGAATLTEKLWIGTQCSYRTDPENYIMF